MEFGMFHEFQRRPGQTEAEAFAESFEQVDEAERAGLDVMWLAELHCAPERSVLAAPLNIATAIATPHETHENRHRRPGAAAVPPAAHRRGSDHRRSHQPRPLDLGRRPQRLSPHLPGLRHLLRRKPGAVRRGAGNPANAPGPRTASRSTASSTTSTILLVPKPFAAPYPEIRVAVNSPDTFQEQGERGSPFSSPPGLATSTNSCPTCGCIAPPGRRPAMLAMARSICACPSTSPKPSSRRARNRRRA